MTVWVIRGGSDEGLHEEEFIDEESIGIYFGVGGDARRPDSTLRHEIREFYLWWKPGKAKNMDPKDLKSVVTKFLNQVKLFRDGPSKGDVVFMPRKLTSGHMVRRGIIDGDYRFMECANYPHRRRVIWETEDVPRESIPYSWYPSDQRTIFRAKL